MTEDTKTPNPSKCSLRNPIPNFWLYSIIEPKAILILKKPVHYKWNSLQDAPKLTRTRSTRPAVAKSRMTVRYRSKVPRYWGCVRGHRTFAVIFEYPKC